MTPDCHRSAVLVVAFVAVVLGLVYLRRIAAEETMPVQALGESYGAYREESWRLVPRVF